MGTFVNFAGLILADDVTEPVLEGTKLSVTGISAAFEETGLDVAMLDVPGDFGTFTDCFKLVIGTGEELAALIIDLDTETDGDCLYVSDFPDLKGYAILLSDWLASFVEAVQVAFDFDVNDEDKDGLDGNNEGLDTEFLGGLDGNEITILGDNDEVVKFVEGELFSDNDELLGDNEVETPDLP